MLIATVSGVFLIPAFYVIIQGRVENSRSKKEARAATPVTQEA
jgi:hypothetical protein